MKMLKPITDAKLKQRACCLSNNLVPFCRLCKVRPLHHMLKVTAAVSLDQTLLPQIHAATDIIAEPKLLYGGI